MRIQISTLRRLLHTSSAPTQTPLRLLDPVSVSNTISSYSNDPSRALDFFHYVERVHAFSHDTRTFNAAIDVLAKFFDFDRAWSLIARMPSPSPDTFRILFNRYASARLPSDAIHAYERAASEFGLKGEPLFTSLVDALCEHKHVIEAEELCFKRGDFPVTAKTHNMILRGYAKLGWWHKCREFWVDFEKGGILRDLHSYSIYMDIVIKSGKPCMAVKLFEEMIERGVRPDVVAYNTVIQRLVCWTVPIARYGSIERWSTMGVARMWRHTMRFLSCCVGRGDSMRLMGFLRDEEGWGGAKCDYLP
ncbi:Pentatricopeptide repeat-containing protein [Acorus calamus]|uniref:Pentatricopeptide repeat-containing protein n=1 Tax=Acorus calamus TaxID=4465 RepID=A0AAV9F9Q9_ACOCL|nr:Pentatricopeptide repeat-containing protein [Acorus calamus]